MGKVIMIVDNLKKYYKIKSNKLFGKPSYLKAVDDISMEIMEGETFGIVGESGCGKSTLGNMLVQLLNATSGSIIFEGNEITRSFDSYKKKHFYKAAQIIFQDPYSSLNPKKKIGWLMEEPLVIHKIGTAEDRRRKVEELIEVVGLDKTYLDKYPHELSGGQRQRICIAIALILNPRFIVADESVSALDVSIQAQVLNLFKKLQKDRNLTYVFISHDLNVVHYISDKIGVMYLGKFVEMGDVNLIYEKPLHPYTQALLSAAPSLDDEDNHNRIILSGDVPSPINTQPGCAFASRCQYATDKCREKTPDLIKVQGRRVRCFLYE